MNQDDSSDHVSNIEEWTCQLCLPIVDVMWCNDFVHVMVFSSPCTRMGQLCNDCSTIDHVP